MRLRWKNTDDPDVKGFVETLKTFESVLNKTASDRRVAWFNTDDEDELGELNPILRQFGDNKGEPVSDKEPYYIKIKLPCNASSRKWRPTFKTTDGTVVDGDGVLELLRAGARAKVVIQAGSIWIMNRQTFGIPFEAVDVVVEPISADAADGDEDYDGLEAFMSRNETTTTTTSPGSSASVRTEEEYTEEDVPSADDDVPVYHG